MKIIKSIDILGPTVTFSIERNESLKSMIGGVLTIFASFMFIGVFFTFGAELYKREIPAVIYNKIVNDDATNNITDSSLLFAIYDQASDKLYEELDRKFVSYVDYYQRFSNGSKAIITRYPMEKCSQETIARWDGKFKSAKTNYFCIPANMTFPIKGRRFFLKLKKN